MTDEQTPLAANGVGVLNEKPLHASLKAWYAQPGDRFEVAVAGSVIDIVRGELLIEIQTRSFSALRRKLESCVASEEYEKAAEYRDEIRALEKKMAELPGKEAA